VRQGGQGGASSSAAKPAANKLSLVTLVIALFLALALFGARALFTARFRSESRQTLPVGVLAGSNILLVTIDTLRADHVGAYGSPKGLTPTLDQFAREGLRFERTYAHVPLTLPSHATIMTGKYPLHNGVRDNGTFRLAPESATLAGALRSDGYRTAAFLGSFVLDARFGLNAGFDTYDDRMLGSGSELQAVERRAEQVLAPAYEWIARPPSGKWFAWVHLYDPHEPYDPPEPYRSRYDAARYEGEIAYADASLGAFLSRLRTAGALEHTLLVMASDHGESLGEHGERTHGLFAYDATLRVPLIFWAKGKIRPAIHPEMTRLVDVAPTILDLVGARMLTSADGRSELASGARERAVEDEGSYFEALNANFARNWAPLTGIIHRRRKLVDLPIPELYDLAADPAEEHNVYAQQPDLAHDLERRLDAIAKTGSASTDSQRSIDADAEARLRALGYVSRSTSTPARKYTAADDPKRLAQLNVALDEAVDLWSRGDAQGAIDRLQGAIAARPDLTIAYERLAFILRASGDLPQAVALLDRAAREGHADRPGLRLLGELLRDNGDLKRAADVLEPLVRGDSSDLQSADILAQTYARLGRPEDAETLFHQVLRTSPNAAATWTNLGSLYLTQRKPAEAIEALSKAIAINPGLATAHNALGVALAAQGDMDRAATEWHRALELRPGLSDARENLSRIGR
jgi:arylsulfatase A-like enzyme/Flp pilus assembly protein TadD